MKKKIEAFLLHASVLDSSKKASGLSKRTNERGRGFSIWAHDVELVVLLSQFSVLLVSLHHLRCYFRAFGTVTKARNRSTGSLGRQTNWTNRPKGPNSLRSLLRVLSNFLKLNLLPRSHSVRFGQAFVSPLLSVASLYWSSLSRGFNGSWSEDSGAW